MPACSPWTVVALAHTTETLGKADSMDFITELQPSKGAITVLVMVDMLTKMAHFIPCSGLPKARSMTQLVICHVFWLHCLLDWVVSDRGAQFTAWFWQALLKELQVCLSSAHHLEINGSNE